MQHLHIQSQRISYPESSYRNAPCSTQISLQSMFWNTKERYPLKSHLRKEHGMSIKKPEKICDNMSPRYVCVLCSSESQHGRRLGEETQIKLKTVELLASFKLVIQVFKLIISICRKDFQKGELQAMVADSFIDIKGWLLVNYLFS